MDIPQKQRAKKAPAPNAPPADRLKRPQAQPVLPADAPQGAAPLSLDSSPPPDYRYRAAASAAFEGRMLSRRCYDLVTCKLAGYLAASYDCVDEGERFTVDRRFGDVALAVRAHRGMDREIGFLNEAYTLARLGPKETAQRARLNSPAVRLYRQYFCCYGALLDNPAYVVRHARIGESLRSADAMLQRKGVWLLIGYFCGWQALDRLLWTRSPGQGGHVWSNLSVTLEHLRLFELIRGAAQAAFTRCHPPQAVGAYAALASDLDALIHKHGLANTATQHLYARPAMQ